MDVVICTRHPLRVTVDTLTALPEEMVIVMTEVTMGLTVVNMMAIMVHLVVVMQPPDDMYGAGSKSIFSSEPEIWCKPDWQDWYTMLNQFKQSMVTMNSSLVYLLHCHHTPKMTQLMVWQCTSITERSCKWLIDWWQTNLWGQARVLTWY